MLALVIGVSITILVGYHILKGYAASGVLLAGGLVLVSVQRGGVDIINSAGMG